MDKANVIEQYKEIAKTYSSFDDCYNLVTETNNVEICKFCLDSKHKILLKQCI